MLNILAESMQIATRSDRPYMTGSLKGEASKLPRKAPTAAFWGWLGRRAA